MERIRKATWLSLLINLLLWFVIGFSCYISGGFKPPMIFAIIFAIAGLGCVVISIIKDIRQ